MSTFSVCKHCTEEQNKTTKAGAIIHLSFLTFTQPKKEKNKRKKLMS